MPAARLSCGLALFAALLAAPCSAGAAPQVVGAIALQDPTRWDYVSVDAPAHRLYVAHRERVDVIDTRTRKPLLTLAPTPGVHGAAPAAALNRVFTSDGAAGTVSVFDATDGKRIRTLKVGEDPDAIVFDPATHRVFAFNRRSNDVSVIDAASLEVLAPSIPAGGAPEFAVSDGHGRVYFNVEDTAELAVLDARTLKIVDRYRLAPCEAPTGLALDPTGRLYSVCRNGVMVVSDPSQHRVIGQAPIGRGPDGVAWLDGRAYSANGRDGTLSVVAETTPGHFATVATVPTARGARTIAADPMLHELFSPTADFKPDAATAARGASGASGNGGVPHRSRPEAIAGSFRVLVLKGDDAEAR